MQRCIIARRAEDLALVVIIDLDNICMAAGNHQSDKGGLQLLVLQII